MFENIENRGEIMIDLKMRLIKEFPNSRIVKLKDLTKKIAVVAKVRIGKRRDVHNYREVTLTDMDEYGVVVPDFSKKRPVAANASAIASQRLHKNDLLVSYRGTDIKVGRIDREYDEPIVGNTSVIRIRFEHKDEKMEEELSIFVQNYLQLPYVKEYIANRPQSCESGRKILSPLFLGNIPIPRYEQKVIPLKELATKRLETFVEARESLRFMQEISERFQNRKNETISLYLDDSLSKERVLQEDLELSRSIKACKTEMEIILQKLSHLS